MRKALVQIAALILLTVQAFGPASLSAHGQQEQPSAAQQGERANASRPQKGVRAVTIPISVRFKGPKAQREMQPPVEFIVREDNEEQRILSIRDYENTPLSVAVLIQDDLVPSVGNELKGIGEFIRRLPRGSRVFVGYIRTGSLQVSQKFTTDLERAASVLRVPVGFASAAPFNPYVEIVEALKRFESLPAGRRAMLVISDGLDISRGFDLSIAQSPDLERAIKEAQRFGVAVYAFYSPSVTAGSSSSGSLLTANAQGSLRRLSDETGGRAFFQGTGAPVSFDPFFRELNISLAGQLALTYLSTHPKKGFHRIEIIPTRTDVEIEHPRGYTRK